MLYVMDVITCSILYDGEKIAESEKIKQSVYFLYTWNEIYSTMKWCSKHDIF